MSEIDWEMSAVILSVRDAAEGGAGTVGVPGGTVVVAPPVPPGGVWSDDPSAGGSLLAAVCLVRFWRDGRPAPPLGVAGLFGILQITMFKAREAFV